MVPHLIHAFWRSEDDSDIPQDVARNLGAWRATHPLCQLKIWSLAEVRPILAETPGAEEAVDTCRFIAMQADIVRLALLVAHGGVWTDLKNVPLQPFLHGLLDRSEATFAEHFPSAAKEIPKGHINNCFIIAPPKHPFLPSAQPLDQSTSAHRARWFVSFRTSNPSFGIEFLPGSDPPRAFSAHRILQRITIARMSSGRSAPH